MMIGMIAGLRDRKQGGLEGRCCGVSPQLPSGPKANLSREAGAP